MTAVAAARAPGWMRRNRDVFATPVIVVVGLALVLVYTATAPLDSVEQRALDPSYLWARFLEHIWLTVASTVVVIVLALPLGIALSRPTAARIRTGTLAFGGALTSSGPLAKAGSLAAQVNLARQSYTVGGKLSDEQLVLCQIAIAVLESVNAKATDQCNIGGTDATRQALLGGDIDLYWEYTGTAWVTFLGQKPIQDSRAQYEAVKQRDLAQNNIVWLAPTPFNNTYAFAVKKERAPQLGLRTLSDMAAHIRSGRPGNLCIDPEYQNRDDGFPGLQRAYGFGVPADRLKVLQAGSIYQAIADQKECLFGEVYTTDGRIPELGLTVLADDKLYHPLYNAAPTMRKQVYDRSPNIAKAFAPISAALTNEVMAELNRQRSAEDRSPRRVARDWLGQHGFIAPGS